MLKIFIILENDGSERYIISVCSTKETADDLIEDIKQRRKRRYSYLSYTIEEWYVDDPNDTCRQV